MPDSQFIENDFIKKIKELISENISNEQFGVSELAGKMGMSRSNLLRKVKNYTNLSVSQFIRQQRLEYGMEMLRQNSYTVSEVSYKVGFSSTSYFIKCFGDHYGYPPGEVGKRDFIGGESDNTKVSKQSHQLVAIMFTDIEGYTSLMQQNEEKALVFRNRHREVFNEITLKFEGKILQFFGDGTLSTFNSAIDAVKCGIELQLAFCEQPQIPVRIGIHTGDIIFAEDGIIGDGVNIASRIESLAAAKSVFISEKVYDEIKNQSGIQAVSLGMFDLKNVDKPIEVFAITNPGLVVPEKNEIGGRVKNKSVKFAIRNKIEGKKIVNKRILIILAVIVVGYILSVSDVFEFAKKLLPHTGQVQLKKSIAVLPFKNDSNDSTNVYIINGLMESILTNLQKIEDLRVISRTSVEKFRNSSMTIPEIAKELDVYYFIEGSGQKRGDQILLNIQLIEGPNDKHLWAAQYKKEAKDIFKLQMEVAKNIADKIEVVITPDEEKRINKAPTENLLAYDFFLKGLDLLNNPVGNNLKEAIPFFEKAILLDNKFARSYAAIAIAYYFIDEYQLEKKYSDSINYFADKALLYDSKLAQSLIAKALYYMTGEEYGLAVSYFEKALEYNPNYDLVYIFLIDLYVDHLPDTKKYLEYALKGIRLDVSSYDSITNSYNYLHISNSFIQSGFTYEAERYINKSLDYSPGNLYSQYVKGYISFAKNRDLQQLKELLLETLKKDTSRLDIIQEIGKVYYYLRDYENAYKYYKKFIDAREALNLNIYNSEDAKIGLVLSEMGQNNQSKKYFEAYKRNAENDQSIYKHLSLAAYYAYYNNQEKAIEHLSLFSKQDNYHYWIVIFIKLDPLFDKIKGLPEFKKINKEIESRFQINHKQIKAALLKEGLI